MEEALVQEPAYMHCCGTSTWILGDMHMSVGGKSLNIERSAHDRKGNMDCYLQMIGIFCQM